MLNLYLYKPEGLVIDNEDYFFSHTIKKALTKPEFLKAIIQKIDGATYKDGRVFKHGLDVPWFNISTGCKTALNVALYPNTVFTLEECGGNAKSFIFELGEGSVYKSSVMSDITDYPDDIIMVHERDGESNTKTYEELESTWL